MAARLTIIALVAGVLAGVSAADRLHAQRTGVVVDTDGNPVTAAIVDLWSDDLIVDQSFTTTSGEFAFPHATLQTADAITARRVGFQPVRRELQTGSLNDIRLVLVEATNLLPELVVESGSGCPNREDSRARALWNQVLTRYRQVDDVEVAGKGVRFAGAVPAARLGTPAETNPTHVSVGSTGYHRIQLRQRIDQEGYARRFSGGEIMGERQFWDYVPLDLVYPQHFTDTLFGRLHRFSIHYSDGARTVVRFCPANARRPHITGMLTLDDEGVLYEAVWSFVLPQTVERAGGRVTFAPFRAEQPVLLPRTAVYWRTTVNGDFFQRWDEFTEWQVGDSGEN